MPLAFPVATKKALDPLFLFPWSKYAEEYHTLCAYKPFPRFTISPRMTSFVILYVYLKTGLINLLNC